MTTRVDFYHLLRWPLDKALPPLLEKAVGAGMRALVLAESPKKIEHIDNFLWVYRADSWLPHGSQKDSFAGEQPIFISPDDNNPNNADLLVLTDGMQSAHIADYKRCLDLFDGNSQPAVEAARKRWVAARDAGFELHYWQQNGQGGWEEKASHTPE